MAMAGLPSDLDRGSPALSVPYIWGMVGKEAFDGALTVTSWIPWLMTWPHWVHSLLHGGKETHSCDPRVDRVGAIQMIIVSTISASRLSCSE